MDALPQVRRTEMKGRNGSLATLIRPSKGQRDVDPSSGAHGVYESNQQVPWNSETSVEGQKNAHLPLDAEDVDESTALVLRDDEPLVEDPEIAHLPFGTQKADESTRLVLRDDESLAEDQRDTRRLRTDLRSNRSVAKRRKTRGDSSDDSTISSATLLAISAFVFGISFVFVSLLVSILTLPSLDSTARLRSRPAPVQPLPAEQFGFTSPAAISAPALPPPLSSEAEAAGKAAPVLNETEKIVRAEKEAADRSGAPELRVPSAKGGSAIRSALTEEEKAAVARGIRELERDAAQIKR